MKKMMLGLGLLLGGVIGFVGLCIAATQTVQQGARSSVFSCLRGAEWGVCLLFAAMAAVGLVISVIEARKG